MATSSLFWKLMVFGFLGLGSSQLKAQFPQYMGISQADYADALAFLKKEKRSIEEVFPDSLERKIAVSCLFPELLRYSMTRNMLETTALELLYLEGGSQMADFSIGHCQMKPSFAEKLEKHVLEDSVLQWYGSTFAYTTSTIEQERKERLERLNEWHWQLRYFQCFFDLTRYKLKQSSLPPQLQLPLYCVAYNKGFELSTVEWGKGINETYFPYGKNFPGKQASYAKVAIDFYEGYYDKCLLD